MTLPLSEFTKLAYTLWDAVDNSAIANLYARWLKSDDDPTIFIQAHIPNPKQVAVSEICETTDAVTINRARKWLSQQKITVFDTVNGPYVDENGAAQLRDFLQKAIAVYPVYSAFLNELSVPTSPASYYRLTTFLKKGLVKTRWHPLQSEHAEFWMQSLDELTAALRRWIVTENADKPVKSNKYMSMGDAAKQLQLTVTKLLAWLYEHPECCKYKNGQYLLSREWVAQTAENWLQAVRIEDIAATAVEYLPAGKRNFCKSAAINWAYKNPFTWQLDPNHYPQHPGGMYIAKKDELTTQYALVEYLGAFPVWTLGTLKECSGYSTAKLKQLAKNNIIAGTLQDNGDYLISTDEFNRILLIADQFVPLDMVIADAIGEEDSLFQTNNSAHRADFMRFATDNNWWDICVTTGEKYPINSGFFNTLVVRDAVEELKSRITSWLLGFRKDHQTKFELLLDHYSDQYPKTVSKMRHYYAKVKITKAIVDMADLLLYLLPQKELKEIPEKQLDDIVSSFSEGATLESCAELAEFLFKAKYTKKQYEFEGTGVKLDTSAYSVRDFAIMTACCINENIVKELDLVRKAVRNPKYAALWLYVAVHIFAAWRDTDYVRLNAPALRHNPAVTLEMIEAGTYSEDDAIGVANYFIADHRLSWLHPNKTKGTSGVAPLYFMCPEDCKAAFGLILSIAAAHYHLDKKSPSFITKVCDRSVIVEFLGPVFLAACGGKNFSGRRANKALMQAVEYEGREAGQYNPLVAYSLASQMRSHKANYGKLAETTDIYLRDVNFAGLSPEYVLYQMFQRGVCSFAVDVMLNKCYGEQYSLLSVAGKTEAIQSVGIHVSQMDIALRTTQAAMDTAIATVQSLGADKQKMTTALRTIAAGRAHGKDMDTQCIVKATGQDCKCPERAHCLGCKYEIVSKALLLNYLRAYRDCQQEAASEMEKRKNKWLADNVILPKIQEIAAHMHGNTDVEELQIYIDLIEEVERNGSASNNAV